MSLQRNLANRLDGIRKAKGLSVAKFSETLGIARSSLQSLLHGNSNPRIDTVEWIAGQLDMDPITLLSEPEATPEDQAARYMTDLLCTAVRLPQAQQAAVLMHLAQIAALLQEADEK